MRASSAYSLFDTESVWAILMRIAPPVMLAQLIQAMYNIVDSYFVGQFSSDGLTALSIVYPVQLIVTAIAVGTGVGVNTLMSRYDGQGNHHLADRTAGTGTVLALISWLIFAVLSGLLMRPFAAISTESSSVADLAVTYGTIVCVGSPGVFLESTWSKVHQARGNMRLPMLAQIAGAAGMSFMHGAQDGQKFIGVLFLGMAFCGGQESVTGMVIPAWLMLMCSTVMGLGTSVGGEKIIKSVGMDMVRLEKYQGFAADLAAAACLLLSSLFGIPVSTTHTKTSAIMGVGAVKRLSAINFGVVKDMMLTWVFTFPGCGLISFVMAKIFTAIF